MDKNILNIMQETKQHKSNIYNEHKKLREFYEGNPSIATKIMENPGMKLLDNQPYFEDLIEMDKDLFLDSHEKYDKQMEKHPDFLLYYAVETGLFQDQKKRGLNKGDYDDKNMLYVTGSNLVLKVIQMNG